MEDNVKVVFTVDLRLPVSTTGLSEIQVFDAVETIRKSIHKQVSEMELMGLFQITTEAYIEDV